MSRYWKGHRIDQETLDGERFNVWVPEFAHNGASVTAVWNLEVEAKLFYE